MKAKILLVEDDQSIGYLLKDNLETKGFEVRLCIDGEQGLQEYTRDKFDLCIVDIMLPKMDGLSLAESIRKQNSLVPILFLTAKSLNEDKIEGFKSGGDDYITKPFSLEELYCRIDVFLKRTKVDIISIEQYTIGKFIFHYNLLSLLYDKNSIKLTQKEADILQLFIQNPNTIVKRETILLKVWGDNDYFMGRSLDVFIVKLRKHLALDPSLQIQNVHGIGFKFLILK